MYNILDFGAVGDGITNDATSIQKAIDQCYDHGGGRVIVPGGFVYNTGCIRLRSHVELYIESGAVLKASDDLNDYYPLANEGVVVAHHSGLPSYLNSEYAGRPFHGFIYGMSEEHVTISGHGIIDANESMFYGEDSGYHIEGSYYPRVPAIFLEDFKQLTIKDITIKNCAFWTVHLIGCYDVAIDSIRILNNLKMANSDGIDPDHCQNVRISNCHIECGDDCIVLKNTGDFIEYGPCENIVIEGCTLVSTSAAIKIGTEGESDFRNIFVSNCTISRSNRGISIQIRDKGNVENVVFSNMSIETRRFSEEWWGRAEPISITAINRNASTESGTISNIIFNNIFCHGENGIFIKGSRKGQIRHIQLNHVYLELRKLSKWPIEGYDVRPCEGEGTISGKLYGLYAQGVKDLEADHFYTKVDDTMTQYVKSDKRLLKVDEEQDEQQK